MGLIISNPSDAFLFAWSIALKYCVLACVMITSLAILISKFKKISRREIICKSIWCMLIVSVAICGYGVYRYLNPELDTAPDHENFAAHFNDVQSRQIVAARKYGITPLGSRDEVEAAKAQNSLKHIRSCKYFQLAPMEHSVPYLTHNAAGLLNDIGRNFRDSLQVKGIGNHKIVVTSILRTDADIEKLMTRNNVAVKNSAHRHATTFDISYTQFVPDGIFTRTDSGELKRVLAEVLRDLRDDKQCYVKYEKSQNCFHITVRR